MRLRVGLENNNEGRSVVWALDHFGCFCYGANGEAALAAMPGAYAEYVEWISAHTPTSWLPAENPEIDLIETQNDYLVNEFLEPVSEGGKLVQAWFQTDWKPLTQVDVEYIIQILSWSRMDLLDLMAPSLPVHRGVTEEQLDARYADEKWSIRQIISHIGRTEWWLLGNLDRAHDISLLPREPFERLIQERGLVMNTLPDLIDVHQVVGREGEFWSPRKVVRRMCWHERDHIQHIRRLLGELPV